MNIVNYNTYSRQGSLNNQTYRTVVIQSLLPGEFCFTLSKRNDQNFYIMIDHPRNTRSQQFLLIPLDKFCLIQSVQSGKLLEVLNSSTQNGQIIREGKPKQYYGPNESNHIWRIIETAKDSKVFYIMNVNSGKVIDVCQQKNAIGTKVIQYEINKNTNQKWRLKLVGM